MTDLAKNYDFEELKEGMDHSFVKTVTGEDIKKFCELTGDYHPLHNSEVYAKENGFNDVIAHGLLISSICSTFVGMYLPGVKTIVLEQQFKYLAPLYPGTEIKVYGKISSIDERFRQVTIKLQVTDVETGVKYSKGNFVTRIR